MIRYYLCPLRFVADFGGSFTPKVNAYPHKRWECVAPTHDHARGIPAKDWVLALVEADPADHATIAADPEITPLPLARLGDKMKTVKTADRNRALTALQARGEDARLVTAAGDFGDMVEAIGRSLDPAFRRDSLGRGWAE